MVNGRTLSYVSQKTDELKGTLKRFVQEAKVEESVFKAMLVKMGFSEEDFDTKLQEMSEGQKKKVLLAKSISEQAQLYVWDEPLNYIDILTREQIEECILRDGPTMVFVEHDERFLKKIATKMVELERGD